MIFVWIPFVLQNEIKGPKILAEIKRILSKDKDKKRKTDTHIKEHEITKIKRTKKQKQMNNRDSTEN